MCNGSRLRDRSSGKRFTQLRLLLNSSEFSSNLISMVLFFFRILHNFNTSSVIFTSNCTQALKIVAETFQFQADDCHQPPDETSQKSEPTAASRTELIKAKEMKNSADDERRNLATINAASGLYEASKIGSGEDFHETGRSTDTGGHFCYLEDNHTSVVGMRESVKRRGARGVCVYLSEAFDILQVGSNTWTQTTNGLTFDRTASSSSSKQRAHGSFGEIFSSNSSQERRDRCLFAFPAQSNFSGKRYPLPWIGRIQEQRHYSGSKEESEVTENFRRWYVLLDAASYVTTAHLDLTRYPADFIALSFYKMFGFPTGLGGCHLLEDYN